ncbi:MAG TPA: FtsX-like permease family protein [Vicinamibacterales bacterium]|nr:FtsX-like permease family protein [Vicinamibacterales bacterium]
MTRHLLRLVWNRKRSNLLVALEILLSFLVLTAVTTLAVFYAVNYRKPLGFDVDRIWTVTIEMNEAGRSSVIRQSDGTEAPQAPDAKTRARQERLARIGQLLLAIRDMPEVEAVAGAAITPYSGNSWNSDIEVGGRRYRYGASAGTDDLATAMGITLTRGRWFSKEDDGAAWQPVVINERLAREMFPDKDPVGQFVSEQSPGDAPATRMRIVGVIREFRKDGEFAAPENFLFSRARLDDASGEVEPIREIVIRVRPGTTAAFEERAIARLRAAAPDWTFQAEPLPKSRETAHMFWLAPLAAAGIVSAFLLVMVGMGLTGVLWLHVTQRTREIGLRRAKGATVANVRRQLVGEVALITGVATLVGVAIVAQLPVLDVFGVVSPAVYAVSIGISLVCIFALTLACAWMPARVASSIEPAEALRYE